MATNQPLSLDVINSYTEKIIGCAYRVSNQLGIGFLEKVYENALTLELSKTGLNFECQVPLKVHYDDKVIGNFLADLLIEKSILVELKAVKSLEKNHFAQC